MKEFDYYERLKEIGRAELAEREARERQDREECVAIDECLKTLPEAEYKQLYDTVKRDFGAQFSHVMATQGSLFESAIKARMARILRESGTVSPEVPRLLDPRG
jgi:hypothetical protein